jgi:hypothetical protein
MDDSTANFLAPHVQEQRGGRWLPAVHNGEIDDGDSWSTHE